MATFKVKYSHTLKEREPVSSPSALLALFIMLLAALFSISSAPTYSSAGLQNSSTINAPIPQELPRIDSNYTTTKFLSKSQREFRAARVDDKDTDTLPPPAAIGASGQQPEKLQKMEGATSAFLLYLPVQFAKDTQPRAPPVSSA